MAAFNLIIILILAFVFIIFLFPKVLSLVAAGFYMLKPKQKSTAKSSREFTLNDFKEVRGTKIIFGK